MAAVVTNLRLLIVVISLTPIFVIDCFSISRQACSKSAEALAAGPVPLPQRVSVQGRVRLTCFRPRLIFPAVPAGNFHVC
jgi:hypothetical protein